MEVPDEMSEVWFQTVGAQGIGLAFTAAFLGIFLWATIIIVRLAIKWTPQLIQSTIATQQALQQNNDRLVDMAARDRRDLRALVNGTGHAIKGLYAVVKKNGDKMGIGSDVVVHFDNAAKEFEQRERESREWQRDRERAAGRHDGTE